MTSKQHGEMSFLTEKAALLKEQLEIYPPKLKLTDLKNKTRQRSQWESKCLRAGAGAGAAQPAAQSAG